MSFHVRPANEDDIDAIYAISCSVHLGRAYDSLIPLSDTKRFKQRYTPSPEKLARFYEKFIAKFYDPQWYIWVAEADGFAVGYVVSHKSETALSIKSLFVLEQMQGKGIGRQLLEIACSVVDDGQVIMLEVIKENYPAIKLYEKHGFVSSGPIDEYYGAPVVQMYKH